MFIRHLEATLPADARIKRIAELCRFSDLSKEAGDFRSALQFERSALNVCEELLNETQPSALLALKAARLYNVAQLWYDQLDLHAARSNFERARVLDEESGNVVGEAADCRGLAFIKQDEEDFAGAIELHEWALELNTLAGFSYGIATDLANIGACYLAVGEHVAAKTNLNEATRKLSSLGRNQEAAAVRNLLNEPSV